MNAIRTTTAAFAAGRIAFGLGLIGAPERVAGRWLGPEAAAGPVKIVIRGLGARDVALSAGMLATLGDPERLTPWLAVTIASDLTDLFATLAVPAESLPDNARWGTVALAGSAAATGAALLLAARR